MFKRFTSWIRQVINSMILSFKDPKTAAGAASVISSKMSVAIDNWLDLYMGNAPWLSKNNRSLGLPAAIASEIARLVTLEMKMSVKQPGTTTISQNTTTRSEYLNEQLDPIRDKIRIYCEYGCAGGGLMLKPYFDGNGIAVDVTMANDFIPLSFNSRGKITSCIFVEHKTQSNKVYHRFEKHELQNNKYLVTNVAYKSSQISELGYECSLGEVPEWESLSPIQWLNNVNVPLFAYFRIPLGNTVDPSSPLGVSVYDRAFKAGLIKDADEQYQRMIWEFEGGELAIDAPEDLFPKDKKGNAILPTGKERLFRPNKLDSATSSLSEIIKTFSPAFRDTSLKNGLNTILQGVEFNSGLAYGTFSDPLVVDKTATEIKASKQRSYSTITDIQKALQAAIEDLIAAMDVYATLYNLSPKGDYEVSFVWDDSIVVDAEAERLRDMQEVRAGLLPKYKYIMKWHGEDEESAKAIVAEMQNAGSDEFNLN